MPKSSAREFTLTLVLYVVYRALRVFVLEDPVSSAAVALSAEYLLGPAAQWALVGLLFYTIPGSASLGPLQSRWTRGAFAGVAVWYAIVWYRLWNPMGPVAPLPETLGIQLLALTLFSGSLFVISTGDVIESAVITVGCLLLGLATAIAVSLSPIPELLIASVLVWLGLEYRRSGTLRRRRWLRALDIERSVGTATVVSLRSEKGLQSLVLSSSGLLLSGIFLLTVVWMYYLDYQGAASSLDTFGMLVVVVTFGPYAAYGIWFWLSVLRRLPTFLDRDSDSETDVVRPVGLFLPASIYMLGLAVLVERPSAILFGLLSMVVGIGAMLLSYRRTTARNPQSAATERWAIPVALFVQLVSLYPFLDGQRSLLVPLLLVVLFFVPDLRDRGATVVADGAAALSLLAFGWAIWPPDTNVLLALPTVPTVVSLFVALVYSLEAGVLSRYRRHTASESGRNLEDGIGRRDLMTYGTSAIVLAGSAWFLLVREDRGPDAVTAAFIRASYEGDEQAGTEFLHDQSPNAWLYSPREAEVAIEETIVVEKTDTTAVVRATFTVTDPQSGETDERRERFELRKQDGEWRIYRFDNQPS